MLDLTTPTPATAVEAICSIAFQGDTASAPCTVVFLREQNVAAVSFVIPETGDSLMFFGTEAGSTLHVSHVATDESDAPVELPIAGRCDAITRKIVCRAKLGPAGEMRVEAVR